jgi:hypothetical protein
MVSPSNVVSLVAFFIATRSHPQHSDSYVISPVPCSSNPQYFQGSAPPADPFKKEVHERGREGACVDCDGRVGGSGRTGSKCVVWTSRGPTGGMYFLEIGKRIEDPGTPKARRGRRIVGGFVMASASILAAFWALW